MNLQKNIVVVGGNAAGPSAAAKAKRTDPMAKVILFEAGNYISTGTCELPYVLSGQIKTYEDIVFFSPQKFYDQKGVEVYINHRIESIDCKNRIVFATNLKDDSKHEFKYDKLILATGSKARVIPALSGNYSNVFYLKTIEDYKSLSYFMKSKSVKNAAVVGSGYIGIEAAEAFSELGCNVVLIEKESDPLPSADKEIQKLALETLRSNSVDFIGDGQSVKYIKDGNLVTRIKQESRLIDVDLLLVAGGFEPNSYLAESANLSIGKHGGIKVDNRLKTSDPHIYAAGDCIEVTNFITSKPEYIPLATIAHEHGHIAGANSTGSNERANPVVKNIAVKIFEYMYVQVGLTESEAEHHKFLYSTVHTVSDNLVKVMPESRRTFGKIIFDQRTRMILGAAFYGGKETVGHGNLAAAFITNKIPADKLSDVAYNYTPPASPFINLMSILGRKIVKAVK
jgi:NADPH-dependent 2,4-dienoyl-CoA reductase/sulfur reductase-like enzyme